MKKLLLIFITFNIFVWHITTNFDSSEIIQEVSIILGGNGGGGRKDLAQAGGVKLNNLSKAIKKIKDNLIF